MKARKLPSGRYNVQVYVGTDENGKRKYRSITADTKKDALKAASMVDASLRSMRVIEMIRQYISTKKDVLSPNTYRGYLGIVRGGFEDDYFGSFFVHLLRNDMVQSWVSRCATKASPKTVRNYYGLFSASLAMFYPDMSFHVKLPQSKPPKLHTPTTAEIQLVLEEAKKRNYELYKAILLGSVGMMRQGEIAALTKEDFDFDNNTISITKSLALQADHTYIVKPPKTSASVRIVPMPKWVMDIFAESEDVVAMNTAQISTEFRRLIKRIKCEHFRFHDLRHYAASIAASSSVGASVASIKQRGGWATDNVMKRIYINSLSDEQSKDNQNINTFYDRFLNQEN